MKRTKRSGIKWWSLQPVYNDITNQHKGPYSIDSLYQISSKPFLIISPSIKSPYHSNLGNLSNKALTSTTPHLLHLNTSIHNSSFIKLLYLSVRIIFMINNIWYCFLLLLILILRYVLAKPTYQRHSILTRPIIYLIRIYPIRLLRLINLT